MNISKKMADLLEVSVDFLVDRTQNQIDSSLLKKLDELSQLPADAKPHIFMPMDALLRYFKAKQAYS